MTSFQIGAQILTTVVNAGTNAIKDYIDMAGDAGAGDMPEYWLTLEIARALAGERRYYVQLENNVSKLVEYANNNRPIPHVLEGERRTGRVDIALYQRVPVPQDADLKCIIEIKMIKTEYSFNDDAARIIALSQVWDGGICGIVAGLVGGDRQDQLDTTGFQNSLSQVANGCPVEILTSPHFAEDPHSLYGYRYAGIIAARVC